MDLYEEMIHLRRQGRKCALATIVHTQGSIPSYESSKMLVRDDGSIAGTVGGGCVEADVWTAAQEALREEKPRKLTFNLNADPRYDVGLTCGGTLEIYVEPVLPQPVCMIFGAGHVGQQVAKIASLGGFSILVADDRPRFANPERFPDAIEIRVDEWEKVFARLQPNDSSYLVIVTRGHRDDMRVLRWAAQTGARYVGLIGSKRKVLEIYKVLEEEGIPREKLERVHAPIGLEVGAVTPEEIAVSIVAEMIAVRRNVVPPGAKSAGLPRSRARTAPEPAANIEP